MRVPGVWDGVDDAARVGARRLAGGACGGLLGLVFACSLPASAPAKPGTTTPEPLPAEGTTTPAGATHGPRVGEVLTLNVPLLDGSLWQLQEASPSEFGRWFVLIGSASDLEFSSTLDVVRAAVDGVGVVIVLIDERRDDAERIRIPEAEVGWDPEGVVPLQLGVSAFPAAVMVNSKGTVEWSASPASAADVEERWSALQEPSPAK
jgi:hypothetical protein